VPLFIILPTLHLLPPERAALCESCLTTSGLAEDLRAAGADDNGLGVRENGGDGEAAGALDVHEERPWAWNERLCGMLGYAVQACEFCGGVYLQLVLAGLSLWAWVQEIDGENLSASLSAYSSN
jgi:hypothetical protein